MINLKKEYFDRQNNEDDNLKNIIIQLIKDKEFNLEDLIGLKELIENDNQFKSNNSIK